MAWVPQHEGYAFQTLRWDWHETTRFAATGCGIGSRPRLGVEVLREFNGDSSWVLAAVCVREGQDSRNAWVATGRCGSAHGGRVASSDPSALLVSSAGVHSDHVQEAVEQTRC